jgi:uncharacterized protein
MIRGCGAFLGALTVMAAGCMPPSFGAGMLLHPVRSKARQAPRLPHDTVDFSGVDVHLKGWWFKPQGRKQGTVVYLHGSGDNRGSSASVAHHFVPLGFEVVAYDSRAHGESDGWACTYGYYEKRDLSRVLDQIGVTGPIILLGTSLGGAVALQAAADDRRISAVIAIATFSDLRTAGSERAPFFASKGNIDKAFQIAERTANFRVDDVSPVAAARRISVPTLLIHGRDDHETPPAHSQRVYAALREPKHLILVPNAGHTNALTRDTWQAIDAWMAKELRFVSRH